MGYFERSGDAGGLASTSLPVPAGHLDDALKSLVVLGGGAGGRVTGLSFASSVTRATARARAGLPTDGDQPITLRDLLVSMKGERVALSRVGPRPSAKQSTVGRVIEVTEELEDDEGNREARKPEQAPRETKRLAVTVLTDQGEVTRLPAKDILDVRPLDPAFARRLDAALDALGARNAQNARHLELVGDPRGPVTFGYIAEAPIWRATYRLVGTPTAKGGVRLQGWALVHNDTEEPWRGVRLELVNGQPDSFLFPLAAPRYARRALGHPDGDLATLPQLQGTTAPSTLDDRRSCPSSSGR